MWDRNRITSMWMRMAEWFNNTEYRGVLRVAEQVVVECLHPRLDMQSCRQMMLASYWGQLHVLMLKLESPWLDVWEDSWELQIPLSEPASYDDVVKVVWDGDRMVRCVAKNWLKWKIVTWDRIMNEQCEWGMQDASTLNMESTGSVSCGAGGSGMSSSLMKYAELQADSVGVILGQNPCSHVEDRITLVGCMRRQLRIANSAFRTCIIWWHSWSGLGWW